MRMPVYINSIQFNLIYIEPKPSNCLKALYKAQCLNPLRANTMATEAKKKLPVNQEGTLSQGSQTQIARGPISVQSGKWGAQMFFLSLAYHNTVDTTFECGKITMCDQWYNG